MLFSTKRKEIRTPIYGSVTDKRVKNVYVYVYLGLHLKWFREISTCCTYCQFTVNLQLATKRHQHLLFPQPELRCRSRLESRRSLSVFHPPFPCSKCLYPLGIYAYSNTCFDFIYCIVFARHARGVEVPA